MSCRAEGLRGRAVLFLPVALASIAGACGGGGGSAPPPDGGQPPQILSFSPTAGPPGQSVVIQGQLFAPPGKNGVRFNGTEATVESAAANEIVTVVPAGATTGPIEVSTPGGRARTAQPFTVLVPSPVPGVSWTTRLQGPRGTLSGLAWDGKRLVVVGDAIQTSSDVVRWDERVALTNLAGVAWNGQRYTAVGKSGFIFSSLTGLAWDRGPAFEDDLAGVASSGALWVAVGRAGRIRTSADGLTWATQSAPTSKQLRAVAWSGSQFVAVGEEGVVLTSPDGMTWTARDGGTANSFTAVGATASLMVATTAAGSAPWGVYTSPDGISWTQRARDLPWANAILNAGGRWVLAADYRVVTSSDGVNWAVTTMGTGMLRALVHTGSEYVAVGSTGQSVAAVYSSPDAIRWTMRSSAQALRAVARSGSDGRLVAVSQSDVSLTSTDEGATWQLGGLDSSSGNGFQDVQWFAPAGGFLALVREGANQRIYSSADGLGWTRGADAPYFGALGASPTTLVDVGSNAGGRGLATSSDGTTWMSRPLPTTQGIEDVFWTGSQFIGVGRAGTIVTSPDGAAWSLRTSGSTASLYGAAASPALLVAVGERGTILTSGDGGGSWESRAADTQATLRKVVWTGGEFVVVGSAGAALRSADGLKWTRQPTPYSSVPFGSDPLDMNDVVWTQPGSRVVVVGTRGLVATSP